MPDRLLLVKFAEEPFNLSFIQAYAPTSTADPEAIAQLYNDVDEAEQQCKDREASIVLENTTGKEA